MPPIQVIIDTLHDEEWFVQIRNWRKSEFGAADAWYHHLDGHDWTLQCAPVPDRVTKALQPLRPVPIVVEPPIDLDSEREHRRRARPDSGEGEREAGGDASA